MTWLIVLLPTLREGVQENPLLVPSPLLPEVQGMERSRSGIGRLQHNLIRSGTLNMLWRVTDPGGLEKSAVLQTETEVV